MHQEGRVEYTQKQGKAMKGFYRGSIMGFARRSRSQSLPLALMSLLLLIAGQNYSTLAQQTLPDDHLVPSMSSSSLPRLPDDFYNDVDGTALSAGFHHTCALEMRPSIEFGGALRCWGFNDHGQASPPQGHFIQVSSGHLFSCGIRIDETVECWGQMAPPSEGLFLQISAGEFHVCGITKESTAKCWGGHVLAALRSPPGEFVQVSSGKDFSCGLRPNGRAACWGDTKKGKTRAPAGVLFKQLSASPYKHYACGVELHERGIVCWGEQNHHGYAANRTGPFSQGACCKYRLASAIRVHTPLLDSNFESSVSSPCTPPK